MTEALFDTEHHLPEVPASSGPEPTIRNMIIRYYTSHGITVDKATKYAGQVIDAALLRIAKHA